MGRLNVGDRVTVQSSYHGGKYNGKTGMIFEVLPPKYPDISDRLVIIADWDGQLYNFLERELQNEKIDFAVGDVIRVINCGTEFENIDFTIIGTNNAEIWFASPAYNQNGAVKCDLHRANEFLQLVKAGPNRVCDHDFKLSKGFRHDEWCCTKCPAKKPFSIYRDAV